MIEKSNCSPELIILNSCYSQGVYEDMKRVTSDKMCNIVAVNADFTINNIYAYKFILKFYKMALGFIKIGQKKINWVEIVNQSKAEINLLQIKDQNKIQSICCENCSFQKYSLNFKQSCSCFKVEREMDYDSFHHNNECKNLMKKVTYQEFEFLRKFVHIHLLDQSNKKIDTCYLSQDFNKDFIHFYTFYPKKVYALNCTKYFTGTNLGVVTSKSHKYNKYLTSLIDDYIWSSSQNDQSVLIYVIYILFLKYVYLEAERYIFNPAKNSQKQLTLQQCTKGQKLINTNGVDFLTTPYPKLAKDFSFQYNENATFLETKNKPHHQSSYLLQYKGNAMKFLQNKLMKFEDYNCQIPIFNISDLKDEEQLKRVFLVDFQTIRKYIGKYCTNVNIFYLYSWCEEGEIISESIKKLTTSKNKQTNIYLHAEYNYKYEDSLFYFQDILQDLKIQNELLPPFQENNPFGYDKDNFNKAFEYFKEIQYKYMLKQTRDLFNQLLSKSKIDIKIKKDNEFSYILDIFNEIGLERNRERLDSIESDKYSIEDIQKQESVQIESVDQIENINLKLLHFICKRDYILNKPLYKYIFKQTAMNYSSALKILSKKSLMRCLLKIVFKKFKDQLNNTDLIGIFCPQQYQYQETRKPNLLNLKSIYQTFSHQYYKLKANFREVVRSIILNESITFNRSLVKSYLIDLKFSKNTYKTFRDLTKIHKRLIGLWDNSEQVQEIEDLLNYLKIKYYFRNAKQNPNYLNLYYISSQQLPQDRKKSELSLILQSRAFIKMIVYADSKLQNTTDLLFILTAYFKFFEKDMTSFYKVQTRGKENVKNQDEQKKTMQIFNQIIIYSAALTDLVKFLSKFYIPKQRLYKLQRESSNENITTTNQLYSDFEQKNLEQAIKKLKQLQLSIQNKVRVQFEKLIELKDLRVSFEKIPTLQNLIRFCFSSYYKLELQIEECLYLANNEDKINIFGHVQDFYISSDKILKIVNEYKTEQNEVSQVLIKKIINSLLSVQYYFKSSQNNIIDYLNKSLQLGKDIYSKSNRVIFTRQLLTNKNVSHTQWLYNNLKQIVIIDEDIQSEDQQAIFPLIKDIYESKLLPSNSIEQKDENKNEQQENQIELLIYLNKHQLPKNQKKTFLKEKRIIFFNVNEFSNDIEQLKYFQNKFLNCLLKNLLKDEKTTFSSLIFNSLDQMETTENKEINSFNLFKESIEFNCHRKEDIFIQPLCYCNLQSKIQYSTFLADINEESINSYLNEELDKSGDTYKQLKEILGQKYYVPQSPRVSFNETFSPFQKDFYQDLDNLTLDTQSQMEQTNSSEFNDQKQDLMHKYKSYEDYEEEREHSSQIQETIMKFFSKSKNY